MKRFKGFVATLVIAFLILGNIGLRWGGNINLGGGFDAGGGFTTQQDPMPGED